MSSKAFVGLAGAGGAFAALVLALGAEGSVPPTPPVARGTPTLILMELFSSEGCSSCPPADRALRALDSTEPVPGVRVIALEEHVDYWDYLGWKDPFSNHAFTARQEAYGQALHDRGIYTPEIVVQGTRALTSRDPASVRRELSRAAAEPQVAVRIEVEGDSVRVRVEGAPKGTPGDVREVMLAVTERGLHSDVRAGENQGRDLEHAPIVRTLLRVGELTGSAFDGRTRVEVDESWAPKNLRYVAFIEERDSRRVLGTGVFP